MSNSNDTSLSLSDLIQKAKNIQNNMVLARNKLLNAEVIGSSENKTVQVTMNGKYKIIAIVIAPSILANAQALSNDITAAVNNAVEQLDEIITSN